MYVLSRFTGILAGAAMALAGISASVTPAKASDDELIRLLLGAAAVAIIVHSFTDRPQQSQRRYTGRVLPDHCRETLRVRHRHIDVYNARCLRDAGMRRLPAQCMETVRTNRGERRIYRERCLFAAGYRAESGSVLPRRLPPSAWLPARCEITYRHRGERMRGYDGACLSNAGLRNLPEHCALRARYGSGHMTIYNAQCLHEAGYRAEAPRRRR